MPMIFFYFWWIINKFHKANTSSKANPIWTRSLITFLETWLEQYLTSFLQLVCRDEPALSNVFIQRSFSIYTSQRKPSGVCKVSFLSERDNYLSSGLTHFTIWVCQIDIFPGYRFKKHIFALPTFHLRRTSSYIVLVRYIL